ncbi:MAG: DUF5104 domain-containing protein [Galbitalea sp.]
MLKRRALAAVVALMCVGLLSACSLLPKLPPSPLNDDSKQQSDAEMQRIADAVKDHDAAALKKLFSKTARQKATDLDGGLKYFLSVFPSGRMTWESQGTDSGGINEYPKETVELYASYKVSSGGKEYELYFADFTVNTAEDPDNVGLYALGVMPYTADPYTASGAPKPFYVWTSQFNSGKPNEPGTPGVYVPQK